MAAKPLILPRDCYTMGEVRRLLRLSKQAVHARRVRGTIPFIQFGGRYMYPRKEIDKIIETANDNAHLP